VRKLPRLVSSLLFSFANSLLKKISGAGVSAPALQLQNRVGTDGLALGLWLVLGMHCCIQAAADSDKMWIFIAICP